MNTTARIAASVVAVETFGWGIAIGEDGPLKQAVLNNLDKILGVHMVFLAGAIVVVLIWNTDL